MDSRKSQKRISSSDAVRTGCTLGLLVVVVGLGAGLVVVGAGLGVVTTGLAVVGNFRPVPWLLLGPKSRGFSGAG